MRIWTESDVSEPSATIADGSIRASSRMAMFLD
jgi:hypothetical protein